MQTQQAHIEVGSIVFSATVGDHGCREGWQATINTIQGETVTATIASNTHCTSCWQVGCVDNGREENDRAGEVITFNINDCRIDDYDQIVVG